MMTLIRQPNNLIEVHGLGRPPFIMYWEALEELQTLPHLGEVFREFDSDYSALAAFIADISETISPETDLQNSPVRVTLAFQSPILLRGVTADMVRGWIAFCDRLPADDAYDVAGLMDFLWELHFATKAEITENPTKTLNNVVIAELKNTVRQIEGVLYLLNEQSKQGGNNA
jgi:hypothetical protein